MSEQHAAAQPTGAVTWSPDWLSGVTVGQRPESLKKLRNESGRRVLLDADFQEWLTDSSTNVELRKRANHLLQELVVHGKCSVYKTVKGVGRGWLRTGLGGTGGSHYYLWWAPYGYPAVKDAGLEEGDVLVRCVRHHDETGQPLDAGAPENRHFLTAEETLGSEDSPFTAEQLAVAAPIEGGVRLVKGYPGSGKTTALWLAASESWGTKALYLTFSRGLAETARARFESYAPVDTAVDVLTFDELLEALGGDLSPAADIAFAGAAAERLGTAVTGLHQQSTPWTGKWHELYAELHAHVIGSALPMPFRGMGAATDAITDAVGYSSRRGPVIGEAGADRAVGIAKELQARALLQDLFAGPHTARLLVDDYAEPLPARFSGVTSVLVDEVQDLTMAEAMLVLVLVARIGHAERVLPHVILAGDEAQTVRPTDFQWAWLNDLVTAVLGQTVGSSDDVSLTSNMRSPVAIAAVVEGSKCQYQLLPKAFRPSGLTATAVSDGDEGHVIYCRTETPEEWDELARLFSDRPNTQLVYPGYQVPVDLVSDHIDIATSERVKGLDYQVVGLVDAGSRHREIRDLAHEVVENPVVGLWARTIADQFRVAVSRAKETLVLLDRGSEDHTAEVRDLCGAGSKYLVILDPAELVMHLDDDETEPEDRVQGHLTEAVRILHDDPERALRLVRNAHENAKTAASADPTGAANAVLLDATRLRGVAAAITAGTTGGGRAGDLLAEAADHITTAGHGTLYATVRRSENLADAGADRQAAYQDAYDVIESLPDVRLHLRELETGVRTNLTAWLDGELAAELPAGAQLDAAVETLVAAAEHLGTERPDLAEQVHQKIRSTGDTARDAGQPDRALACYAQLADPPPADVVGPLLEDTARWTEATDLYEDAGLAVEALRCAREIPDLARAVVLAETADTSLAARLRWALQVKEMTGPEVAGTGHPLTQAELDDVLQAVSAGLPAALTSQPIEPIDEPEPAPAESEPAESDDAGPEDALSEVEASSSSADALGSDGDGTTVAPPTSTAGVIGSVTVAELALELDMTAEATITLCKTLGVPAADYASRVAEIPAERVRRRAARMSGKSAS